MAVHHITVPGASCLSSEGGKGRRPVQPQNPPPRDPSKPPDRRPGPSDPRPGRSDPNEDPRR